jgi:hypothetical protein
MFFHQNKAKSIKSTSSSLGVNTGERGGEDKNRAGEEESIN